MQGDSHNGDTIPYIQGDSKEEQFNTAIDDTSNDPMIIMSKPLTTAFVSVNVCIPTEKVGCLQVTNQLREFLIHFPPDSKEKAFEQIYEILHVLQYVYVGYWLEKRRSSYVLLLYVFILSAMLYILCEHAQC